MVRLVISGPFDRKWIETILPHRGDAQLLDWIHSYEPNKNAVAEVDIRNDLGVCEGHFPQKKIIPGHILAEMGNLTCAIILLTVPDNARKMPILIEFSYKAILPVRPPKKIIIHAYKTQDDKQGNQTGYYFICVGCRKFGQGKVKCKLI